MKMFQSILILGILLASLSSCRKDPSKIFDGEFVKTSHKRTDCSSGLEDSRLWVSSRPCEDGDILCSYTALNFSDGALTQYSNGGIVGITSHTTLQGSYTADKREISICIEEQGIVGCINYHYTYNKRQNKLTLSIDNNPNGCKEVLTFEKK